MDVPTDLIVFFSTSILSAIRLNRKVIKNLYLATHGRRKRTKITRNYFSQFIQELSEFDEVKVDQPKVVIKGFQSGDRAIVGPKAIYEKGLSKYVTLPLMAINEQDCFVYVFHDKFRCSECCYERVILE